MTTGMFSKLAAYALLLAALVLPGASADEVRVGNTCPGIGEQIEVSFVKDDDFHRRRAWIAIYRRGDIQNPQRLPEGVMWTGLCGSQRCNPNGNPLEGTVVFESRSQLWEDNAWPIPAGRYQVILSSSSNGNMISLATADFEVDCDNEPPVPEPAPEPVMEPAGSSIAPGMARVVERARADIRALVDQDELLPGKFLRLMFHDCVGGCDGCIDMTDPENAGLVFPIRVLEPIVQRYESEGLSRTDIWMLSSVVASEATETSRRFDFPFQWVGRKTCDELNNNDCGRGADGRRSACEAFGGPLRVLCHGDTAGTRTIQRFMRDEFDFDAQETAAIMGAHSVGAMRDVNLGFEGRFGWDITNNILDHGYYAELVGPLEANWVQVLHDNSRLSGIPDRWQFEARVNNIPLTMLNSDIAMVRNLVEGENLDADGRVTCNFRGNSNPCPRNTPFMEFIERYSNSRRAFLEDYIEALLKMIDNGYVRGRECPDGEVCVLTVR